MVHERKIAREKILRQDNLDACEMASNCKENDPLKDFFIEDLKDCRKR